MNTGNPSQDSSRWLLIVTVSLALVVTSLPSGFAAQTKHHGDKPGSPWTGNPGIAETVDQIMARESSNRETKIRREHENHRHEGAEPPLQDNPLAPLVPQWPVAATSGSSNGPGLLTPQSVGTSFQSVS